MFQNKSYVAQTTKVNLDFFIHENNILDSVLHLALEINTYYSLHLSIKFLELLLILFIN